PDRASQLWLPVTADPRWPKFATIRLADAFCAVGRLKPGISLARAQADMDGIARRLAREYPQTDAGLGVVVTPLERQMTGARVRQTLWMLFAAVTLLLLIACSNVANLLLARGAARGRELAVRSALGAARWQIVRQLLAESLGLWLCACAVALTLAPALVRVIVAASPESVPRLDEARVDPVVLAAALGISLATGLVFGLIPAWKASSADANLALRRGGVGTPVGHTAGVLVAVECAFAAMLLVGAGLLARSLARMAQVDPGYRADHLLTMEVHLPFAKYGEGERAALFFEEALEKINALPGVASAAVGGVFSAHVPNDQLVVEGKAAGPEAACASANSGDIVSEDYFRVMGIRLLRGRYFSRQDRQGAPLVAIVNDTMARRCWPGENPLGKRFRYGVPGLLSGWIAVVGVAADTLPNGPESQTVALHYLPLRQHPWVELSLVVRTTSDPARMVEAIRSAIGRMDTSVPRFTTATVEAQLARLNAPRRFETWLLGMFSLAALVLAGVGIYGVVHESVARRTQEIGVRMALGARAGDVVRIVVWQGIGMACAGMAAGIAAALALARLMQALLFDVAATDPFTFGVVGVVLVAVAAVASAAPACRAARVDPIAALRAE
ncbi:MAG: ADOP family duplicated permease, partial [Bryobacteraceae bacterium]